MTTVARRTRAAEQQFIIDTPARAHAELARITAAGRLDAKAPERPYGDREVIIPVWVFPESQRARWHVTTRAKAIAAVGAVVVPAGVFAGYEVFEFVKHYFAYIAGSVVVVLIVVAWLKLRSGPTCDGVHFRH